VLDHQTTVHHDLHPGRVGITPDFLMPQTLLQPQGFRALLEGERLRLQEEIRGYPTPIPRCDQQFNHLIAQREVLFSQLARLDAVTPTSVGDADSWWDAFVDSSDLEADLKRRIEAAGAYVPVDSLCLSPQCGFSSTHHGNAVSESEQWRKLELVVRVAREVWGSEN